MNSEIFKYADRGYDDLLVLVPGWAANYRVFDRLDLDYNYILPVHFSPFTFNQGLRDFLKRNDIKKISLLGWSLGGFLAAKFASCHKDIIDELILIGIRKKYKKNEIELARNALQKNKKGYLIKFYTRCFPDREKAKWFKENLLRPYCAEFSLDSLLDSLSYLERAEIIPGSLRGINRINIIHGESDIIAPIEEAIEIGKDLVNASFVTVKGEGHMPFFAKDFRHLL